MLVTRKFTWAVALGLVACLAVIGLAWARSEGFALNWRVVAGGGGEMSSASQAINGTLGQLAIGPAQSSEHAVGSGYWYGVRPIGYNIYLPLVLKQQ